LHNVSTSHIIRTAAYPKLGQHRLTLLSIVAAICGESTNVVTKPCNLADRFSDRCFPVRRYPSVDNILWSTPRPTSVYIQSAQKPNTNIGEHPRPRRVADATPARGGGGRRCKACAPRRSAAVRQNVCESGNYRVFERIRRGEDTVPTLGLTVVANLRGRRANPGCRRPVPDCGAAMPPAWHGTTSSTPAPLPAGSPNKHSWHRSYEARQDRSSVRAKAVGCGPIPA